MWLARLRNLPGWLAELPLQATGVDNLKAALRLHGVAGNIQGQLAIQTAAVRVDALLVGGLEGQPLLGGQHAGSHLTTVPTRRCPGVR